MCLKMKTGNLKNFLFIVVLYFKTEVFSYKIQIEQPIIESVMFCFPRINFGGYVSFGLLIYR